MRLPSPSIVVTIPLLLGLTGCALLSKREPQPQVAVPAAVPTAAPAARRVEPRFHTLHGSWTDPGKQAQPVTFEIYHPPGELWGEIQAKRDGAEPFRGMYVHVKSDTKKGSVRPIIVLWSATWKVRSWNRGADPWSSHGDDAAAFLSEYKGFLVAELYNEAGESLRCRFKLRAPERGVVGGATGTCQTSTGGTITLSSP
jgi:hypothetical protein